MTSPTFESLSVLARRTRVVMILEGTERAGLVPVPIRHLHALAFLTNVLAPVWQMPVMSGSLLKRRSGAFYPDLQANVDRLVGEGVVVVSGIGHSRDEDGRWRLDGSYRLGPFGGRIIEAVERFAHERSLLHFIRELVIAASALADGDLDRLFLQDATYSDRSIDFGNVIDFGEWQQRNFAANAAAQLGGALAADVHATPAENLHLYVRHLQRRLHGAQ